MVKIGWAFVDTVCDTYIHPFYITHSHSFIDLFYSLPTFLHSTSYSPFHTFPSTSSSHSITPFIPPFHFISSTHYISPQTPHPLNLGLPHTPLSHGPHLPSSPLPPPPFTHSLWFHLHNFPRAFQTTLFKIFGTCWKNINLLISSVMWWCRECRASGTEIRIPGSTVNIPKSHTPQVVVKWGQVRDVQV